ncbi:MAG TPA: riboflavin synthase [Ferruginibacter sp.]|jgi:riboflavin synthase|nr:riboflavin synthase [Ferruginibacter sp.]
MFTGIIETIGIIEEVISIGTNRTYWIQSPISAQFSIDQSISHNGVCLTVEEVKNGMHRVTAIDETLAKTNLKDWKKGNAVNIERCLQMNGRLDGHIVQGHVDTIATCINIIIKEGSWEYNFEFDQKHATLIIEKGSVTINGISLTLFNVTDHSFMVAIIPYTYQHTNMQYLQKGDIVNIEFDMIGKYVNRFMQFK